MTESNAVVHEVWKKIASGGVWRRRELTEALPHVPPLQIQRALRSMVALEMVHSYGCTKGSTYGITKRCRIPRGLDVGTVLEVLGA